MFRLLATVEDWGVRCDVANRVGVPPDVLAALAYDEDSQVRETAFRNSAMPERVYDDVIVRDAGMSAAVCDALKGGQVGDRAHAVGDVACSTLREQG